MSQRIITGFHAIEEKLKSFINSACFGTDDAEEIDVMALVNQLMDEGLSTSAAIKEAAKRTGISKNEIYRQVHASE